MKCLLFAILTLNTFLSFGQKEDTKVRSNQKGYFNITKIGYISVSKLEQDRYIDGEGNFVSNPDSKKSHAWSLQTINGYFISPHFSLGIAVGLDGYHKPTFNTLPVLLDVRFYLNEEENSFYSFLDIGPSIKIGGENSKLRKGMVFNIGLGYKFRISDKLFLVSDISFAHKTISLTDEWIDSSDLVIKANGVGLNIGILF